MHWIQVLVATAVYQTISCSTVSKNLSETKQPETNKQQQAQTHSKSEQNKTTKQSVQQNASYRNSQSSPHLSYTSSGLDFPFGYGFRYASDYDGHVSLPLDIDPDLDPDLNGVDFIDPDLDLDFNDIDLDIDLLKLKYGLYGLNHFSLHDKRFNDYQFRRRYRLRKRPYYRHHHRYLPRYWKQDLDFWGLDNYSLGYDYGSYHYDVRTPHSYVHVRRYGKK